LFFYIVAGGSARRSTRVSEKQSVNYYPPFELDERERRGRPRKRIPMDERMEVPAKRRKELQLPDVDDDETEPALPAKSHKSKHLRKIAKKQAQQQQEAQQEEQQQEEQEESEVDEAGEKKVDEHGRLLEGNVAE